MNRQRNTPLASFRAALNGPLGPTTLSHALRCGLHELEAVKRSGASWAQIALEVNACLVDLGRPQVGAPTVRAILGRLLRNPGPLSGNAQPGAAQLSGDNARPEAAPHEFQVTIAHENTLGSMQGESPSENSSMIDQADALAAILQKIKDVDSD